MADVNIAIQFVLRQEDALLTGAISDSPYDFGGRTRFGVAERFHPELTNTTFYTTMPREEALGVAEEIYNKSYCIPLDIVEIKVQDVANALLSFGVNLGPVQAIKEVQRAIGVPIDGIMGPVTLGKINSCVPLTLLRALKATMNIFYLQKVEENPSQSVFLTGWLNRVNEACGELNGCTV